MNLSETIRRAFRAEADSRMDSAGGYRREPWRGDGDRARRQFLSPAEWRGAAVLVGALKW
jgi:hypothetical protein